MQRVVIQWTETAVNGLKPLPAKVRHGLLDKAGELLNVADPSKVHKHLTGPLQGYYRICYSRYRAIYSVQEEELADGQTIAKITVLFVAAGIRKEGDKKDIYRLAQKLLDLGIIRSLTDKDRKAKK